MSRRSASTIFRRLATASWTDGTVKIWNLERRPRIAVFADPDARYQHQIGGAYGIVMLLNVWGIIWPNNKRILAGLAGTGPAAPPELAREAFIASRTNTWMSLPMLWFMGTSHGDWVIFGK